MRVIIFGAGGQAKETVDFLQQKSGVKIVGLIDRLNVGSNHFGYKVIGRDDEFETLIKKYKATHFSVAIGDVYVRAKLYEYAKRKLKPVSIISKKAFISKYVRIGEHAVIYPGVVINADATIGNNVLINSNVTIAHEVGIGDHVDINPGVNIAGKTIIEDLCFIGIGASLKENLRIAQGTVVGGGAMVIRDTKPGLTYIGVPARAV